MRGLPTRRSSSSFISAAFLAVMHQHHQALTPSLYGLAAQTARRSFGPDAVEHRCAGIYRIHTRVSVPTLFMPTPTKRTITQTSRTLKRHDLSVALAGVGDA
jgi:hypothetical protein